MINIQSTLRTAPIGVKMFNLQYYLVATVIHVHSIRSQISLHVSMYYINKHTYIHTHIFIYIHGSAHRDSILIRSNMMQQYAGVYLLQNYSTCFGCLSHPSSEEHQTVTAASGRGHSVRATTFRQLGLIGHVAGSLLL